MATQTRHIRDLISEAPVGSFQWRVFALCFLIATLDGFDTQSIAFIGPAIAKTVGLAPAELTWILTSGTIGMTLGAMGLGILGDQFGRRPAILASMALFGVCSFAGAYATSPFQIVVLRFLIGLGTGGATPTLLALAAEYSPMRLRGAVMTGVLLGLPAGAMLGGLVASAWLPTLGWQGIFMLGGALPTALLLLSFFLLPESLQLLAAKSQSENQPRIRDLLEKILQKPLPTDVVFTTPEVAPEKGPVGSLFLPEFRMSTIAIWTTYLFNWIAWFMFLLWLPTALTSNGLPTQQAAFGTVAVNASFIVFAIPLSIMLPRVDSRRVLLAMFATGIAISLGLAASGTNWTTIFVLIAAAGFGIGGQQIALNYLIISVYPTKLRATGTGWAI